MDEILSRIGIYHRLSQFCFGGALVFLIVSVILFFRLDIRAAAGYLSGRKARREIKRLEEEKAFQENREVQLSVETDCREEATEILLLNRENGYEQGKRAGYKPEGRKI